MIDKDGNIKLADFGLASENIFDKENYSTSFCGTPYYLSPEMIKKKNAYKTSDFFALGILTYQMINGHPPFTA